MVRSSSTLIMASFIMSAAVPWMGVLMAAREALLRCMPLRELMSLMMRFLPVRVSV